MAKNLKPNENTEQKAQTKYDRKIAERKQQAEKNKRDDKLFKIGSGIFIAAFVVVIAAAIIIPIYTRHIKTTETYIKIGDREVTELEFDYYYNSVKNSYSPYLSYMGVDTSTNFEDEPYSEDLTWGDLFAQDAAAQMRQVFALSKDAEENGFSYDASGEYEAQQLEIEEVAETNGISVSQYYKLAYGTYATEKNTEPFVIENIVTNAYYNELLEKNVPSEEEIDAYYNENRQTYDKVDYRYFDFQAELKEDASEDEIAAAMKDLKKKAESFMEARKDGTDFEELCIKNASEEEKADYEDTETEKSLATGSSNAGVPAAIREWLYDDARTEGDITVIEDADNNQYYVVEFIDKYYDEASDATISDLLASETVTAYVTELTEAFEVKDVKGELKYLTVEAVSDEQDE